MCNLCDKYRPNLSLITKCFTHLLQLSVLSLQNGRRRYYKSARRATAEQLEKRLNLARYISGNLWRWLEHFATICLNKLVRVAADNNFINS